MAQEIGWLSLASLLVLLTPGMVEAQPGPVPRAGEGAVRGMYLVQLDEPPLARYRGGVPGIGATSPQARGRKKLEVGSRDSLGYLEHLHARQERALDAIAKRLGREVSPSRRYSLAFHGLALELTEKEAEWIARLPGVRNVQPDRHLQPASDAGPAWTGATQIWDGSGTGGLPGTKGEGIVVGVLDTGIDLGHPSFADVGGDGYNHVNPRGSGNYVGWCSPASPNYDPALPCNDKLIGVWSYPDSGDDPRDGDGHGTHVASIAAGNYIASAQIPVPGGVVARPISGVAPHANLIAYDVCGEYGCYSSTIVEAVEQATADGVDVIVLALWDTYSSSPWADSISLALLGAREAGIFVAAAAGGGSYGYGAPASAPWVLSTGAATHNRRFVSPLTHLSGGSSTPPPGLEGQSLTGAHGPAPIVYGGSYGNWSCEPWSPFPPGTFSGQIVVCEHDPWDDAAAKAQNLLGGGAGGMILADSWYSYGPPLLRAYVLPTMQLSGREADALFDWLGTGTGHSGRIGATEARFSSSRGDWMEYNSPYGSGIEFNLLKPDVVAPGQEIFAAYRNQGYAVLSGTSMAAGHAGGAAALLVDLHPDWTPAEIQSALVSTAVTGVQSWDGGGPADILAKGGGRLSLTAARAGLVFNETIASFEQADPGLGGHPEALNLASLADSFCVNSCGWTRVARSTLPFTTHWSVATEPGSGFGLAVTPSSFTLGPGGTQVLQITATRTTAPFDWSAGQVVLTEAQASAPQARLPVAVQWFPDYLLSVARAGLGSGRVTSSPAGIDCGADCSERYPYETYVTLTATPDPGAVFVGWSGNWDCDGAWPVCSFDMWSDQSVTAHFNPPIPDQPLANQVAAKASMDAPVEGGTWAYYSVDVESGTAQLVVDLFDLSADATLYIRQGQKPTWNGYNCSDWDYGMPTRRCVIMAPAAGRWWIGVNNDDTGVIRYSIRASWGAANDRGLANRSEVNDFLSSTQAGGAWKYYFFDVSAGGADLVVDLFRLTADADLYLRHGAKPDRSNYDCMSDAPSVTPDRCAVASPAAGRWWVGVNNFASGTITYTIQASWSTVDTPTDFYTLLPCRAVDTRGGQPLASGVPRILQISGVCGVPAGAKAVSVNVTVVGGTGSGFVTLYPGDEPAPSTGTLNFQAGRTRANNALLSLGRAGAGSLGALATMAGPGQVHLIVDVNGYWE